MKWKCIWVISSSQQQHHTWGYLPRPVLLTCCLIPHQGTSQHFHRNTKFQIFIPVLCFDDNTHDSWPSLIKLDNCIPACRVCPVSAVWLCQVAGEDNYFLSHQEKFPPSINGQGPTNLPILFQVSLSDGRMQSVSYTSDDYGDNKMIYFIHLILIYWIFIRRLQGQGGVQGPAQLLHPDPVKRSVLCPC